MNPLRLPQSILAIDPGKTTGVVLALRTGPKEFEVVRATEIPWEGRIAMLQNEITTVRVDLIVIEDFKLYGHRAKAQINNDFPSVQVIGNVQVLAWQQGIPIEYQMASVAKPVSIPTQYSDVKQIRSPHIKDAFRHLRYYVLMTKNKVASDEGA